MAETSKILQPIEIDGSSLLIGQYESIKKAIKKNKDLKKAECADYKQGWLDCLTYLIDTQKKLLKSGIETGAIKVADDPDNCTEDITGSRAMK